MTLYFPPRVICHTCGRKVFYLRHRWNCLKCIDYNKREKRIGKKPLC